MATTKSVKRKLTEKIEKVSGFQNVVPGRVGRSSTEIDTGIPGLIYVRIEGSGQVVTAVNTVAPSEYNHPVLLARSKANKKLWEVIASRQAYTVPVNRDLRYHHSQHEHPNPDTVWVKGDQFLPFLVTPDTGFVVKIFGGVVTLGGTRYLVANQSLDLSSLQPAVGAVWVLIEVTSAGAIDTVVSTEYDNKELLTPDLIPTADAGAWDICAVRLYGGQESLQRGVINDFVDLRFGKPGGSDIVTIAFLDDIGDVNAPSPTDGQVLTWDAYAEEWIAADPSGSFDIHALAEKTTIADEDEFPLADSAASFAAKQIAWGNVTRRIFHDALRETVELEDDFSTGADGWTLGTGWAHDAGNEWVEHTPGDVDPLSFPGSTIDEAVYWLLVNVGGTTGTVTARVDAAGGASVISAGAGTVMVACKSSGGSTKIMIVPSSDFDGYISSVTVIRAPLIQDALPDSAIYARQDQDWVALDTVFQPLDADLTAIAALTPTNDDVLQRKAGAWVNRTIAQLITDLTSGGLVDTNLLLNGGFPFWQRAAPATPTAMTDDVYNAPDRWYSLVQGAGATINRNAGIGTSQYACKIIAGGTTNRYGIAQIIEAENSIPLRGQTVIAQCRIKPVNNAGSGNRDYRIAILEWTGTADAVTSELVADWTSGTFTTAGFFAATSKTLVATAVVSAAHNTETLLSVSGAVSSSCNNLIVFVWAEDVPTHASDYVLIGEAGLYIGAALQTWKPPNVTEELLDCQRYYCKSHAIEEAPADDVGTNRMAGFAWQTTSIDVQDIPFPVRMRTTPTIAFYKPNGVGSGSTWAWYLPSAGAYQNSSAVIAVTSNDRSFIPEMTVTSAVATAGYIVRGGWAADAEL
jgi:hypothetical protein